MGVSGMLVGTVMMSDEGAYVVDKIWNLQNNFEVQIKMCFMMEEIPKIG